VGKNDVIITIKGTSKDAQAAVDKLNKKLKGSDAQNKKVKTSTGLLRKGWVQATIAIGATIAVMKKLTDAAAVQERAEITLAEAMKQAGTFTDQAFQHNLKYAQSLQKMTTYGDEAILGVQKMLTNFGMEGEVLDKLTKSTLDLAAAKGMDLRSAADLVAKTVGSTTNALTRYGITVEGAAGSTARAETAVQNIAKIFGGAAQAETKTFDGAMKQLKNTMGDIAEKGGKMLIDILQPIIVDMKKFLETEEGIKTMQNAFRGLATVLLTVATAISIVIKGISLMVKIISQNGKGIAATMQLLGDETLSVGEKWKIYKQIVKVQSKEIKNITTKSFGEIADSGVKWFNKMQKLWKENGTVAKKTTVETTTEIFNSWDTAFNKIEAVAVKAIGMAKDDIIKNIGEITNLMKNAGEAIGGEMGNAIGTFGDMVGAMKNGILGMASFALKKIVEVSKARKQAAKDALNVEKQIASERVKNIEAVMNKELEALELSSLNAIELRKIKEAEYQKEYDAADELTKRKMDLEKAYEKEKSDVRASYEDALNAAKKTEWEINKQMALINVDAAKIEAEANMRKSFGLFVSKDEKEALTKAMDKYHKLKGLIQAWTFPSFAEGGSFVTDGPQLIQVGDNPSGKERVDITPEGEEREPTIYIENLNVSEESIAEKVIAEFEQMGVRLATR